MNEMLNYRITILFEEVDDSVMPWGTKELDCFQSFIDTGSVEPSLRKEYVLGLFEKLYGELELMTYDFESIQEFRNATPEDTPASDS